MTPADVVARHLLDLPTVTALTRAVWLGGVFDPVEMPAISIQVAERSAYSSVDFAMRDTRADLIIAAAASTYQAAHELAEVLANSLHGIVIENGGVSIGPITWERLEVASLENYPKMTVFQIPQVFACNIRRQ